MPAPFVVFSSTPWSPRHRRAQHLITRLARLRPVLYVEAARSGSAGPARIDELRVAPGVTVLRPAGGKAAASGAFFESQADAVLRAQARLGLGQTSIAWLCTPRAAPLLAHLYPELVIYDCHEDESDDPEAARLESILLSLSDLVFAAGPSLYRHQRQRHPNVHCLPRSVERAPFAKAAAVAAATPAQGGVRRLGYAGTIDERIDLEVLKAIAQQRPNWVVELVGPIAPGTVLPELPNLRYLGTRAHADIPALVASWDVCLLPYLRCAATRYLNPIQVLEYMAAQRPIVSTPVPDVLQPYSDVIYFGANPDAFVAACQRALHASRAERERRAAHMREILSGTSWDDAVMRVHGLVDAALKHRLAGVTALLDTQRAARLAEAQPGLAALPERAASARLAGSSQPGC